MSYLPIEDYALIGDMHTAALVGNNGSIDWLCLPHVDSPSVFAAILDDEKGGSFRIHPDTTEVTQKQLYWPDTNVLITRFLTEAGAAELVDFMPVGSSTREVDHHEIIRIVTAVRGEIDFRVACRPAFDYARGRHETQLMDGGARFAAKDLTLVLTTQIPLQREGDGVSARFSLRDPTGAIIAAPTTSLPEGIGGERNWDYRFTWIRDAAFTVYALMRIGFTEEAGRYVDFLQSVCKQPGAAGPLQLMYGIDGRRDLTEERLEHLAGYRGSAPVRIGNGAYDQLQLDIYGELIDSMYLYNRYGAPLPHDTWESVRTFAQWVVDNWQHEDEGIWEVRGGRSHFVYSKLMCWVALDRATRIAEQRSLPADTDAWKRVRDTIYQEIMSKGWNERRGAFVQRYDSDHLDAATLMMPLVLFVSPVDDRMLRTLDAVMRSPADGGLLSNSLVYRYNVTTSSDGLAGDEGTFNICTFWLVEALTRVGRYKPEYLKSARQIFERMLGFASPLGLYAEETGPRGEALGNFPQAFTHLSLISAAVNLDRALG